MTHLLISRPFPSSGPRYIPVYQVRTGDILIRRDTGECCAVIDITRSSEMGYNNYKLYHFRGFVIISPAMDKFFKSHNGEVEVVI